MKNVINDNYNNGYFRFYNPEEEHKSNTGSMISFNSNQYHSVDSTKDESKRFVFVVWLKSK